jgi:hypothetical protein
VSDDDIAQLKRMRDRGEITSAQYETLRRHVLWGTPLPEAVESLGADAEEEPAPAWQPYVPGRRGAEQRPANPWPAPDDEPTEQYRPPEQFHGGAPRGQHRAVEEPRPEPYQPAPRPPQPGYGQQPAWPPQQYAAPYTGPPSGAVPAIDPQTGRPLPYTGPPSGSFPAIGAQTGHYTGPPSGAMPAIDPLTGRPAGSYTGPATGTQPAVAAGRAGEGGRAAERGRRAVPEVPGKRTKRRRGRGPIAFLLSIVLAVALAGAGVWWFVLRETGVAPADYARGVCAKVQSWHDDVTAKNGQLQQALNSNNDPEATRGALATFFDQVADRTRQLRSDVDSVGIPRIETGQSYVDGLGKKLDDTASAFGTSASRARALNPDNPATFEIDVQVLQSQADQQITGVTQALAGTNTPGELRTAYNNASGCAPFTG